ncbi:MAG: virulence factor SrfB [Chitinispirillales bacterium]|jgi:hypothetical protein|nr:virulence factor SrfB [Chitinispirillales bacterium]
MDKNINFIANTGIHYHVVPLEIDMNDNFKMYFHEWHDSGDGLLKLELAHYFSEEGVWVKKRDLSDLRYVEDGKVIDTWENILKEFAEEGREPLMREAETQIEDDPKEPCYFPVSLAKINWEKIENVWLPAPFFSLNAKGKSEFGPINWCRCKLIPFGEAAGEAKKYHLLFAFDTRSLYGGDDDYNEDDDLNEVPVFAVCEGKPKEKNFAMCNNEYKLVDYCSDSADCGWVDGYMLKRFHNLDDVKNYRGPKPKLNYLAQYIFLMRYIEHKLGVAPKVTLFPNKNVEYGYVDLVVDIGNSRTCAVLFDGGRFDRSSPLLLQDFTEPAVSVKGKSGLNKYHESFDMRLVFRKADFGGNFGFVRSRQFVYPSMVRLGKEANSLMYRATNMSMGSSEKKCTFSSPKRFLWDTKEQKQEWEFVRLDEDAGMSESISIKGVSEQLNSDGSLNIDGVSGAKTRYSRRTLMTFAFLEILAQAKMQINSFDQRNHWKDDKKPMSMPRKVNRIIITCPTAMSNVEQVSLRKCAEDAAIILDRFFKDTYGGDVNEREERDAVQVIPSAKKLFSKDERTEWIYDEATAAQFVYLYAEIREGYMSNAKDYFDTYGKAPLGGGEKSLTVGSVDIGAGTTDVMIAAYKCDGAAGAPVLTPAPLFWESFYEAGDDLLKALIQRLVIEEVVIDGVRHSSPIVRKLQELGKNSKKLMEEFLGNDTGVSSHNRQMRSYFNLQVSVPIVLRFLEMLRLEEADKALSFDGLFVDNKPTEAVLEHFKEHFGFEFEELEWKYDGEVVSKIVEQVFEPLIGKIAVLFSKYACDIVLMSGRPTSLKPLSKLFLNYYAVEPNRLKTMHDYRVGHWYPQDERYPFIDEDGYFVNPKSVITTGAMIGQLAENGKLDGFSLDLSELKKYLTPKTNYFGLLDRHLDYTGTIISLDKNLATIEIPTLAKPVRIGVRQLDIDAYPSRPFYTFDFDESKIEAVVKEDNEDAGAVRDAIERKKDALLRNRPLKVTIVRDKNENIEELTIDSIVDGAGNEKSKNFFNLQVQSMSEIDNYWLDSGIFSLNLNRGDD